MLPLLLLLVLIPGSSWATTYYVSTTGSDSNDGLTVSTTKRTVSHCVSIMVAGDTCYVRGGTYNETLVRFSRSGSSTLPIILMNYPGEAPVIDFQTQASGRSILIQNSSGYNVAMGYITVEGFEVKNGYDGMKFYNAHNSVFRRNWIHDNYNQGILGIGGHDNMFERNIISHNGNFDVCAGDGTTACAQKHGIYAHGRRYTIINNVFYDNIGFGVQQNGSSTSYYSPSLHPSTDFAGADHWIVSDNTFAYQHNAGGFVIWGSLSDDGRYENNIFYENRVTGTSSNAQGFAFSASGMTGVSIKNNHFYGSGSGGQTAIFVGGSGAGYTESGNVVNVSPPAFVNGGSNALPASPDFRLTASAPVNIALANEFPNNTANVVGAFKTVGNPSCSVTTNIITCTFPMSTAVPISNLSTAGVTIGCTGSNCPGGGLTASSVSNVVGTDTIIDIVVNGFTDGACLATLQDITLTYQMSSGTWTAFDNIGPYPGQHQDIFSFTDLPVSNDCTGSGSSGYPAGYYIYYKFDEGTGTNADDESTNNLDGTLTNSPSWGSGKKGSGVTIADGTTQYVAVPYGSGLNPTTQSLTIAFGINIPQGAQSLTNGHFGSNLPNRFYISKLNGSWRIGMQNSTDSAPSDLSVDAGWNHLCLTVDASTDTVTLHKNGVASDSEGARKTITSYTLGSDFELGHIAGFTGGAGTFDDFLVYQSVQDCAAIYAVFQASSSGPGGTFSQEAIQAQAIYTVGGLPVNIASMNAEKTVVAGGAVAVVFQIHCENVSDCDSTSFKVTYRRNGSATRVHVPNVETSDGIWMYGQSTDAGLNTGLTTTRLTGTCPVTTGSTQLAASQTPAFDLPQDGCVMLRYLVRVRNAGDYFDLGLQTENDADLNGGYDVESRITVIPAQANAGP